jgi:hypothetical protein
MKNFSAASLAAALFAAALLTGCGFGPAMGRDRGPYYPNHDPYNQQVSDVRGTVDRVDTRNRTIVVNREDNTYNLRNGNDNSRQAYLYYDERTTVSFQGKTFRPEDLESGDRIAADVDQSSDRLIASNIQVLYDVSSGNGTTYDNGRGTYGSDRGTYDNGTLGTTDLRGTVRYVDTRNRTLEIDRSGYRSNFSSGTSGSYDRAGDIVVVHYDADTVVRYQGRRYSPENLERGDQVEIDLRSSGYGSGNDLLAQEIVVVGQSSSR